MLSTLEENDMIASVSEDGRIRTFSVYANLLLGPADMKTIAEVAARSENTLILVTCENESAEGGYLNRRVVFAEPVR